MGKLIEYIKLLPKGLKNIDHVVSGMRSQLKLQIGSLSEEDEDTIIGRRLICEQCPYNSKNAVELGLYSTQRVDEHCIHCQCVLLFKTADLTSNCGIEAYNKNNPDNQIELKWKKVK